ncbi:MAG: 4'-phosphopantetheinyl transferase superfamily protein, partial [Candidatus Dormibacteraceae bacterium]
VEKVARHSPLFLEDYFTAGEQAIVKRSPSILTDTLLTILWSAKESALKALQSGLRSDTRCVSAHPSGLSERTTGAWLPLTASHDSGWTFYGWWRRDGEFVRTVIALPDASTSSNRLTELTTLEES